MYDTNENTVKSWLNYGRKNMRVILESLQKQNKSFLGIAIVPFFIWMFSGDIERATTVKAAEIAHTIILSEAPKKSAVAKTFLTSAKGKAVVGIVAVGIVVGGIALQANHSQNKPVHKPQIVHVKKDKKNQIQKKKKSKRRLLKKPNANTIGNHNIKPYIMLPSPKRKPLSINQPMMSQSMPLEPFENGQQVLG